MLTDDTARVEVFAPVESDLVSTVCDFQIIVSGVHCTSDEVVVRKYELLEAIRLFQAPNDIGSCTPEEMIPKKHSDGTETQRSVIATYWPSHS